MCIAENNTHVYSKIVEELHNLLIVWKRILLVAVRGRITEVGRATAQHRRDVQGKR